MIWFFGSRHYGKVDHVPGLFFVTTSFFHIQFVPLVPTGSYLMIDDGREMGKQIGMSGKSVFFTYLRAACILGGIGLIIGGVALIAQREILPALFLIPVGVASVIFFFVTYKLARPSADRALQLAEEIGLPPEIVAQCFVDNNMVLPAGFEERYAGAQEVMEVEPVDDYDDRANRSRPPRYRD